MLWETAYAEFVFTDTLWPDFGADDLRAALAAFAVARPAVRRPVSAFWSRIAVALVLLPLVLGIVWLGGWWLFAVALVGGLMALHELYVMGRGLRPIVLGGYVGLMLTLLGAEAGDISWMVGGIFSTRPRRLRHLRLLGRTTVGDRCDLAHVARRGLGRRRASPH